MARVASQPSLPGKPVVPTLTATPLLSKQSSLADTLVWSPYDVMFPVYMLKVKVQRINKMHFPKPLHMFLNLLSMSLNCLSLFLIQQSFPQM